MPDTPDEPITKEIISGTGNVILPDLVGSPNDPERPENSMAITA